MIDGVDEGRGFVGLSFNMCYFSKDKRFETGLCFIWAGRVSHIHGHKDKVS